MGLVCVSYSFKREDMVLTMKTKSTIPVDAMLLSETDHTYREQSKQNR